MASPSLTTSVENLADIPGTVAGLSEMVRSRVTVGRVILKHNHTVSRRADRPLRPTPQAAADRSSRQLPVFPEVRDDSTVGSAGGGGLRLVDALASRWGTTATATGKT